MLSVCIWLSQWWLFFVGDWWWVMIMGVGFKNNCSVWRRRNVSKVVPRLYGWAHKILWLPSITAENNEVVVTNSYLSGGPWFNSHGWPILDSCFIIFVFSSSRDMRFVILAEDSDCATVSTKILEHEGSIQPSSFYGLTDWLLVTHVSLSN